MTDWKTRQVCKALCQSGKFETGQGGCALLCMSMLGSSRSGPHGCEHAEHVHGDLAHQIIDSMTVKHASWREPTIEERPF